MAYYVGPCSCAPSVDPGIFDHGIISPPAHATLIANQPVKIEWASNGTATHFSLALMTYTGHCYDNISTHSSDCRFSNTIEQILLRVPDTGHAQWTPGPDLESRNDYVLVGTLSDMDQKTMWNYQQGFYTILKREGDTPLMLPTYEDIQRNLTKSSATSSTISSATASTVPTTSTAITKATNSAGVGASHGQQINQEETGLLLFTLLTILHIV